ncbi:hypothetical protein M0805_008261 [Coniferiporia weirii]|nr:hypothetical protein M0805_008261 [Coniferiporia weirii]
MTSLIAIAREKFLEALRSVHRQDQAPRWRVLVTDEHSQRILYNALSRNDILEENVSAIFLNSDPLYEAQPDQEAIYMLMPTTQNIERIINEFANGQRQFRRVHLFFVDAPSEELFARLTSSPALPYLACATELYLNFWALEAQVFSIESPAMFFSMFSPPRNPQMQKLARERLLEDLQFTARHIANTCIALNEFPYIRYYTPSHHAPLGPFAPAATILPPPPPEGSGRWRTNLARGAQAREYEYAATEYVSRALAFIVQAALEEYEKANPEFPKKERGRGRATLLITDRSMDTVAPFLHEFTYQAMANDLLEIDDGVRDRHVHTSAAGREERDEVLLNDEDPVWVDVRHMHMREAIDKLMEDFNKFLKEHTSFRGEGPASMDAMKDMIATLPQYQKQMSKFSLHLAMAQKCMNIFEKENLPNLATVEQNCATGLTAEGKTPKSLVEEMVPILDSRDPTSNLNKLRIIALYIQFREGVPEEDRRRLCQHARLKMTEIDAIGSLAHMGVRITRGAADKDIKRKLKTKPTADEEYDLSRYKPILQTVLDDQVAGKLDTMVFPYVKDSPLQRAPTVATPPPQPTSLRSTRPTWHKAPRPGVSPAGEVRERLLVFVAGGMTYSEMRTAYVRAGPLNRDIIIGSTHTFTPGDFMDDMKVLELEGVGSRVVPKGVRPEPFGSYQRYYDDRYFQAPPRPRVAAAAPPPAIEQRGSNRLAAPDRLRSSGSMTSVSSSDKKKKWYKF